MKAVKYVLTRHIEGVVVLVILFSILLIPGYKEKLPLIFHTERGLYFVLMMISFLEAGLARSSKAGKKLVPFCYLLMFIGAVGVMFC